jgi:hypothetical protein
MHASKKVGPYLFAAILTVACAASRANYAGEMQSAVKRIYGKDFPDYTFRGTPVGNFGVGTMYSLDITQPNLPIDENWLVGHPNTWFDNSVSSAERSQLMSRIIERGDFGDQSVTEQLTDKLGLSAAVPAIHGLVSGGADINLEKGVKVVLKAAGAKNRRLNWTEFQSAAQNGKIRREILPYLQQRNFVIAADDIELSGYAATITVDKKVNAELAAKLDGLRGTPLGDGSLKVAAGGGTEGTYEVTAVNPVVIAVLYRRPPAAIPLANERIDDWAPVRVDVNVLRPLEDLLITKGRTVPRRNP